ncbi:TPA: type I restriction endonuclease subunit R, partial [Streptococcus suis]|nr:type I restriction endonuclease subunit R [Streptococcus suis]
MTDIIQTDPIIESNNFIVLDKYVKSVQPNHYQTEADLEKELIVDLQQQGYEYLNYLTTPEALLGNLRAQMEMLNRVSFTDEEWQRFLDEYLNKPSESLIDRTRKLHDDHVYDFIFDDGHIQNIYLWDKKNISRNKLQVINQMKQTGTSANRYDVTLLVNGLPLVQIELKKRGVAIREAFNQVHRYSKESFNEENSLFNYLQLFIISNGTDTRYFANTTKRNKNSFDFTMNWALKNNNPIKDLKDFTATFLSKQTLLNILINYSVFDTSDTLLIMRPYQIAATERIIWKIRSAIASKIKSGPE